jgi:demethylmenaquinone methyltransferase/2-methoxy-6-polyprenyl-1,4-benzoquinol methylase
MFRQRYYDFFSRFYDRFVSLHSRDRFGESRAVAVDRIGLKTGYKVLDVCTGTGTALTHIHNRVGREGLVVGLDFSWGMLRMAQKKLLGIENVFLVMADARHLPFKASVFDAVICSFAFYELKKETQEGFLCDVGTILKAGRPFVMIEHDVPRNPLIRMLFYVRLFSMGRNRALGILKHERDHLARHFSSVTKLQILEGKSKMMKCRN